MFILGVPKHFVYLLLVISVRCMAQFVGRETIYNTVVDSVVHIYNNEGIKGFYQ